MERGEYEYLEWETLEVSVEPWGRMFGCRVVCIVLCELVTSSMDPEQETALEISSEVVGSPGAER